MYSFPDASTEGLQCTQAQWKLAQVVLTLVQVACADCADASWRRMRASSCPAASLAVAASLRAASTSPRAPSILLSCCLASGLCATFAAPCCRGGACCRGTAHPLQHRSDGGPCDSKAPAKHYQRECPSARSLSTSACPACDSCPVEQPCPWERPGHASV